MENLKTYRQWAREGRGIIKGSKAAHYRVNDDRTAARALFSLEQTQPATTPDLDEIEGWSLVIPAQEWEDIRAEAREVRRGPRVKIRRPETGGVAVWCGPDTDLIKLLKARGFEFDANTRYWIHRNKDAEAIASAFENGKVRQRSVKVIRDFGYDRSEEPQI